jgi:N-ethylmaleimide reductase
MKGTAMTTLFDPIEVGALDLPNRIVMAPLTRNRSPNAVPGDLTVTYYRQRAGAGLLITEATAISHQGQGYAHVPGLYAPEQIAGWRKVTDAVHEAGGRIVVQLWHVGRISHVLLQPGGAKPVAPSAIRAKSKTYLIDEDGSGAFDDTSEPRALDIGEIPGIVEDYRRAARAAVEEAGFDGVEIHAANGYLIDQFLRSGSNHRTDAYGGSVGNRARFLFEVAEAVTGAVASYGLAYVHVIEGATGGDRTFQQGGQPFDYAAFKTAYRDAGGKAAWLLNNGYDKELAEQAVSGGTADLVAFGRLFISNPDLVERLRKDIDLAAPDKNTFYGGGAKGYIDYPTAA